MLAMPLPWRSAASRSASARVPLELSTMVHALWPAGHVVSLTAGVAGVGVADGVALAGVGVAVAGAGVGVCGTLVICSEGLASSTIARISASSAIAKRTPTIATGPRQPRGAAITVPTAVPQSR